MKPANLAFKFLLELAALAALAVWGADTGSGVVSIVLAVAAPLAMIVLWGLFAAPRAARRLPPATRIPFELTIFALAAAALAAAGHVALAIALAAAMAINAALLSAFDQWSA